MPCRLSVILPVHNQAEIITPVTLNLINILKQAKIDYEVVMVENGSKDKTKAILKKLAKKNHRVKVTVSAKGYGRAVIHGLKKAKGQYLLYMPSDGQVDNSIIPKVLKQAEKKQVDLVKVMRISRESLLRKVVSLGFNWLANIVFGLKSRDINGSPTCFAQTKLKDLKLISVDSFLDTEILIKARALNWKIIRLPMKNFKRAGGKSTVKPPIIFEFLANMWQWKFGNRLTNFTR